MNYFLQFMHQVQFNYFERMYLMTILQLLKEITGK